MANWKKVVVSGSSAELANVKVDSLTSGQVVIGGGTAGNLTTTAVNGTGNIVATTGATGLSHSGSFSGSFQGLINSASYAVSSSRSETAGQTQAALTFGEGLGATSTFNGSTAVTVSVSGAADLTNNILTKWDNTANKFVVSSLTDNGTVVSGASSIQLSGASTSLTGSFTGSFTGDGSGLTGIASTLDISGSNGSGISINLKTQDLTITGTANEIETAVAGTTVTIGLPDNVTISGNLTVQGTASFQNTENLLVADRFVLFASGSNATGDGGIVVQQDTQNVGEFYGYDSATVRWGFTSSFNASTSTFAPDAFVAAVVDLNTAGHADVARYQKNGNIKIDTNGDIFIYS